MIRRNSSLILFLIFLFLSFPLTIASQTSSFKLRVTEELANIRQHPDIRSPILVQVTQNTILYGLKREGEWYLVTWADEIGTWRTGYIHESLVAVVEAEITTQEKKIETTEIKKEEKKTEAEIQKKEPTLKPGPIKKEPEKPLKPLLTQPKKRAFKINLAPGLEFLALSQVNEANAGLASLIADLLNNQQEKTVSSLHWMPAASVEVQLPLKSPFSALFQVSGILAQKKNSISYRNSFYQPSLLMESQLQVVPVAFLLSFDPWSSISLAAGPEIIWAEYRYLYRLHLEKTQEEWQGKARTWGYGLKGKINLSAWLSSNVGLSIEIGGRMAKVSGFEGKDTHLLVSGEKAEEKGKLYFFHVRTSPENIYSLLFIREKKPSEAGVEEAHEATLNLSGLTIRFGLSFRF